MAEVIFVADKEPMRRTSGGGYTGDWVGGALETYFQDGGRRAGSLEEVHFTDIEHLEFDL